MTVNVRSHYTLRYPRKLYEDVHTMTEPINEKVDVISYYNRIDATVKILKLRWNGRVYVITHHDYHQKKRIGRVVFHYFHVASDTMYFRLKCDPDTLHWLLEEVSDGS